MKCTKCGKEIDNDSKFCDGCGETIIAETPAAPKKKVSKKLIAIIAVVVAAVILVVALASGSDTDSNSLAVETGEDDAYGGVAFNLTLEEFVEKYNASLGEYDVFDKIIMSNFKEITSDPGTHSYTYDFGYTSGSTYHSLATVSFQTNDTTGKIQAVSYIWKADGYNTEKAKDNYYYTRPARIFSFFYDKIEYPTDGNISSYCNLIAGFDGKDTTVEVLDNTTYGLFNTGNESLLGIRFIAMTPDSELADSMNIK